MSSFADTTYPLYPVFAFLGFLLSVIPLPWHIQAWNSGTCAFMIWTALSCLNYFINSIVWRNNLRNPAPVWCDISSKLIIGVSVAIPASILCISRRLYLLTSGKVVSITRQDKRRMVLVDLGIAVGMPVIIMALHYVIQGHRFDLLEDVGCYPVVYNTLPAYFLYFMWTPLFGCVSLIYSTLTLRSFWIRRAQFNQLLSSNSSMSISRYLRLIVLALTDIMCTVPLGVYTIYIGNKGVNLAPWISWEDTHFDFSRVGLVPRLIWYSNKSYRISLELSQWLPIVCAFLFFALFGFAEEARKHYKLVFWFVAKPLGIKPAQKRPPIKQFSWTKPKGAAPISTDLTQSLPTFIQKNQQSPALFKSPVKSLERANSSLSSTSTRAGRDYELTSYKLSSVDSDIEKSAGITSAFTDCDTSTLYSSPPVYQLHSDCSPRAVSSPSDPFTATPAQPSPSLGHFAAQQKRAPLVSLSQFERQSFPTSPSESEIDVITPAVYGTTHQPESRCYLPNATASGDLHAQRVASNVSPPPFTNATASMDMVSTSQPRKKPSLQVMVYQTETTAKSSP